MANGIRKSTLRRQIARTEQRVSAEEVQAALACSPAKALQAVCFDRFYYALPANVWDVVLQYTGVDEGQYEAERYDCDDFAFAFKAAVSRKLHVNGVGFVADGSGEHAYNALLVAGDELSVAFVEPQNDMLVIGAADQYPMQSGFVLF